MLKLQNKILCDVIKQVYLRFIYVHICVFYVLMLPQATYDFISFWFHVDVWVLFTMLNME